MSKSKKQSRADKAAAANKPISPSEAAKQRAARRSAEVETTLNEARAAVEQASAAVASEVAGYRRDGTLDAKTLRLELNVLLALQDRLLNAKERHDEHWDLTTGDDEPRFDFDNVRDQVASALDRIRTSRGAG